MKSFVVAALIIVASNSALAAKQYTGKCAKLALQAAVNTYLETPAAEEMEYMPFSAHPSKKNLKSYDVVLALNFQGDAVPARYEVTFSDLNNCKVESVKGK